MTKAELLKEADRIEQQLRDTREAMKGLRSVQADVANMVVPMLLDQLKLIRAVAEAI